MRERRARSGLYLLDGLGAATGSRGAFFFSASSRSPSSVSRLRTVTPHTSRLTPRNSPGGGLVNGRSPKERLRVGHLL